MSPAVIDLLRRIVATNARIVELLSTPDAQVPDDRLRYADIEAR